MRRRTNSAEQSHRELRGSAQSWGICRTAFIGLILQDLNEIPGRSFSLILLDVGRRKLANSVNDKSVGVKLRKMRGQGVYGGVEANIMPGIIPLMI
jgi:hypothetical protein